MVFLFIIYLLCGYFNPFLLTLTHLFLPFPFSSPHFIISLNNPFCFCFLLSMYDMSAVFGSSFHFAYFLFSLGVDGWVLYQHDSQWGWLKTAEGRKEGSKYGCTYLLIYQARAYLAWIDVCLFGTLPNSLPFLVLSMLPTTYYYIPTYVPFRNFSYPSQSISFWHRGHTCWIMYILHRRYGGVLTSSSTSLLRILRTSSEIPMPCHCVLHFPISPQTHCYIYESAVYVLVTYTYICMYSTCLGRYLGTCLGWYRT